MKKRRITLRFCSINKELFLSRCSDRANLCAVAAADALVRIDNENVTLGNAANRALRSASAACDAIFRNLVSHFRYLHI